MEKIQFRGAAGEVTGSRTVFVNDKGTEIGIDRGMVQGPNQEDCDRQNLDRGSLKDPKVILLSHGHIDHIGLVPQSEANFFATPPTKSIMKISLTDSQRISPFLYSEKNVDDAIRRTTTKNFDESFGVDGSKITFKESGHVLGAASIEIEGKDGRKFVFSGDLGPAHSRTVRPAASISGANVAIVESTYGDEIRKKEDPVEVFAEAVTRTKKKRGKLIVATFALDRAQAILNIFKELQMKQKLGMPVFFDAPTAILMTKEYERHKSLLSDELREQQYPFKFDGLFSTYEWADSEEIRNHRGALGIISSSGMLKGGRIGKHLLDNLSDPKNTLLLSGYAAEGTPSRAIADGEKEVIIENECLYVGAEVITTSSLSAHADQQGLFNWVKHLREDGNRVLETVFVNHGVKEKSEALANRIRTELRVNAIVPEKGVVYELNSDNN